MRVLKNSKTKVFTILAGLILFITVILASVINTRASTAKAWNSMKVVDLTTGTNKYWEITHDDLSANSAHQTHKWDEIETNGKRFFDDIMYNSSDSMWQYGQNRLMYLKKLKVTKGQTISIVAASDDTETTPGTSLNNGNTFYYSVLEFDESGNIVHDGDWRPTNKAWQAGVSGNNKDYGSDGIIPDADRDDVAYIVILFRLNNGDLSMGGGGTGADSDVTPEIINTAFPNFYIAYNPFKYEFDTNGGTFSDGTSEKTLERTGLDDATGPWKKYYNWSDPTRTGYTFKGWKITNATALDSEHKQYNQVIQSSAFESGFYSSLFNNNNTNSTPTTVLEAQWTPNTYTVKYNANGGSGSMSNQTMTYTVSSNLTANTFTRTGYTFRGWSTSESGSVVYTDKQSVKNLSSTQGEVINLYAVWSENTYNIDVIVTDAYKYSIEAIAYTASQGIAAPTRTGYTFTGWKVSGINSNTALKYEGSNGWVAISDNSVVEAGSGYSYFTKLTDYSFFTIYQVVIIL